MEPTKKLGTKRSSSSKLHRGHVEEIYKWCKKKYGRSRYNGRYPDIVYKKGDYDTGDIWGYYDEIEKLIFVNSAKHDIVSDLVHTIIHEYTHYKQSMHDYSVIAKYLDPLEHPLEKEADQVAERDTEECISHLKQIYGEQNIEKLNQTNDLPTIEDIYCQRCQIESSLIMPV